MDKYARRCEGLYFMLVLVLLGGCTTPETEAVMNAGSQVPAGTGVFGQVVAKSDVSSIPDLPLRGFVLAVAEDVTAEMLKALGMDEVGEAPPNRVGLPLSARILDTYVTARTQPSPDGTYALELQPGPYWLCLADAGSQPSSPTRLDGCLAVAVTEGPPTEQDLYWGEGGLTAR